MKNLKSKYEKYIAYWKTDRAFYQISGNMEEKEFIKLIENIRF